METRRIQIEQERGRIVLSESDVGIALRLRVEVRVQREARLRCVMRRIGSECRTTCIRTELLIVHIDQLIQRHDVCFVVRRRRK